jgi:curli production assembly/transport component CsgG
MKTYLVALITIITLGGCGTLRPLPQNLVDTPEGARTIDRVTASLEKIPAPAGPPVAVAVYGFRDLTGQRKSSSTLSLLSSAVTQGADAYLIRALQQAGNRQWFTVVERVGLDNLLKERQMIRQTREIFDGNNAKPLPALTLAGVLIEGGIIDYNTNIQTGGMGARYLGIGPYTQYTQDVVVISLRLVSVQTGEVLLTVTIEKNLLSTQDGMTVFRFFNQQTRAFELDASSTRNEPGNYALRSAIETGVAELIRSGESQGLWHYKK